MTSRPSHRQWIFLVCLFLLSLPAVTPRIYSSDEIQYFAFLRSVWFDRDLSFENEYRYFYDRGIGRSDGFHETFLERTTETGRRLNFGTVGCAILWAPFYGAGHLAAKAIGAPQDGYSKPYLVAIAYASALYGFLGLVLAIRCAERLGLNGFGGGVAVWLGTPLLFYMYLAPPFAHACSAFAVALFTYIWLRVRGTWSPAGLAALGAAGALMAMTREQDVLLIGAPALDWLIDAARGPRGATLGVWIRDRILGVVVAAVSFVAAFLPQLVTYTILNGHLGPHSSVSNKMKWYAPHALQVLFSPEHGFFIWTPLAMLALVGLVLGFRGERARRTSAYPLLLLMFLLNIFISGSVDSWTVAGGFGQRRFVALTTVLVIGVSALLAHARARKMWTAAIVVCVYWNLALTAEFATQLMDRQKLEPARNAYVAFVVLPRMAPSLAYRYLFDRQSFYRANPLSR